MARRKTTEGPAKEPTDVVVSDPASSYVAGSVELPVWVGHRILAQSIDDLECDVEFSLKVYDEMANEPILGGATDEVKIAVLEDGWRVQGAIKKPVKKAGEVDAGQEAEFKASEEIREYIEWNLRTLSTRRNISFVSICWDMLSAIYLGHRLAEWTLEIAKSGPYAGAEILGSIKVKNRRNYAFALSATNDLMGIVAKIAGRGHPVRTGLIYDVKELPNAIDPRKFWVLTLGGKEGDPRGTSQYRRCYAPWYEKRLLRPERLKYGVQFGGGKVTVELGENTPATVRFANDKGEISEIPAFVAAQKMAESLSNGRVGVFPNGCKVLIQPPAGDGTALAAQIDACDREMVYALKKQLRQTMEAKHGSKADSETAENIADKMTNWLRGALSESIQPLIQALVLVRFGEDAADRYCPSLVFSSSSTGDLAKNLEAHGKAGYRYHESQFAEIDADIGAPERADGWEKDQKQDEDPPDPSN